VKTFPFAPSIGMRPPLGVLTVRMLEAGVEGVHVGRMKLATNTAVWMYRVGDVFVDTATPNQWHKVKDYLQTRPAPSSIVVSHHHEDHAGNLARMWHLYQGRGATVALYAPKLSHPMLHNGFPIEWYRDLIWGRSPPDKDLPVQELPSAVTAQLENGEKVRIVNVAAPGHCADHTVFYVPERKWLFCADLYVTSRPKMAFYDEKPLQSIATLKRMLRGDDSGQKWEDGVSALGLSLPLPIDTIFCAHRGRLTDGAGRLNERLEWLEELRHKALQRYQRDGVDSIKAISKELLGKEDEVVHYISRGDFSRLNLISGLLADVLRKSP
jgi:glyoxylase-like metal-dependent hydrolase (beta-lactamase superfamily II)